MVGFLLAIKVMDALPFCILDQLQESDLTAVADLGKHRLPKKELPHTHPIEASPELVILPELNTVCVALEVQGVVGLYHLGVNPCARFLAGAGASAHHL